MFFDRRNSRRVRDLVEISGFLEMAIEQLEKLEHETLQEIERANSANHSSSGASQIKDEPVNIEFIDHPPSNEVCQTSVLEAPSTSDYVPRSSECQHIFKFASGLSNEILPNNIGNETGNNVKNKSLIHEDIFLKEKRSVEGKNNLNNENHFSFITAGIALEEYMIDKSPEKLSTDSEPPKHEHIIATCNRGSNVPMSPSTQPEVISQISRPKELNNTFKPDVSPQVNTSVEVKNSFKVLIKFKTSLKSEEIRYILEKNSVRNIEAVLVNESSAVVTFSSEDQMEALLQLNSKKGKEKIGAWNILRYKGGAEKK